MALLLMLTVAKECLPKISVMCSLPFKSGRKNGQPLRLKLNCHDVMIAFLGQPYLEHPDDLMTCACCLSQTSFRALLAAAGSWQHTGGKVCHAPTRAVSYLTLPSGAVAHKAFFFFLWAYHSLAKFRINTRERQELDINTEIPNYFLERMFYLHVTRLPQGLHWYLDSGPFKICDCIILYSSQRRNDHVFSVGTGTTHIC